MEKLLQLYSWIKDHDNYSPILDVIETEPKKFSFRDFEQKFIDFYNDSAWPNSIAIYLYEDDIVGTKESFETVFGLFVKETIWENLSWYSIVKIILKGDE